MKQPIALVLSSGGARGLAQIGIIEELVRQDFQIKSIAGSSIGSVIGAMYAMGKLEDYKNWIKTLDKIDVFKLIDFTFSKQGLIKGDKVFEELKTFIQDEQIENLPIPFAAVATDILNEKEIVFTKGSVYKAIRASIAIPSVLTPIHGDGKILVDGGVLNPIPINRVERTKGDLLVAVNLYSNEAPPKPKEKTKKQKEVQSIYEKNITNFFDNLHFHAPKTEHKNKLGYFDLINSTSDAMLKRITELTLQIHQPDILINISQKASGTFDFYKAEELIEQGRQIAAKSIEEYDKKMINKYKNLL